MRITTDPQKIEAKSLKIVEGLLAGSKLPLSEREIAKRVVHATADVGYAKALFFSPGALSAGLKAVRAGKNVVVDVNMAKVGMKEKLLRSFGGEVICLLDDSDVVARASRLKVTRAMLAMRKAVSFIDGSIVAIGNAPTALFEISDLVKKGKAHPALIVGVPVGFVGALESKRGLRGLSVPYITNFDKKGGSSVACAIVNALLILAKGL